MAKNGRCPHARSIRRKTYNCFIICSVLSGRNGGENVTVPVVKKRCIMKNCSLKH